MIHYKQWFMQCGWDENLTALFIDSELGRKAVMNVFQSELIPNGIVIILN